jgi:GGDEF domain-containing protein
MVNVSKGMAVYQQGSDATVEEVLNRADELMYEDKTRYKNSLND